MKNRPQLQFNLLDPLLVDNFAGGGGATLEYFCPAVTPCRSRPSRLSA